MEHSAFVEKGCQYAGHDSQQIEAGHNEASFAGEKCVDKKGIDRDLGGTAHEGCQQDGHTAVPFTGQCSSRHDRRYTAAEPDQHGDYTPARETDPAQEMVHDKGHSGNISAVLQKGQKQEHDHNDRYEAENTPDACKDSFDYETVDGRIDPAPGKHVVYEKGQVLNPDFQQSLEICADHIEGEIEDQSHDQYKDGDRRIFTRQYLVDLSTAQVLFALSKAFYRLAACLEYKRISHIGDRGALVHSPFIFHLNYDVFKKFLLIPVKREFFQNPFISLNDPGRGKADGDLRLTGMVFNQMCDSVKAAVDGSAVVVLVTEILPQGTFLVVGDMDGMLHQLFNTFAAGGRDGNDRNTKEGLQFVNIDGITVSAHFIHHVEGDDHGNVHFQELYSQIQIALNICGVNDIDDRMRFFVEYKFAGDQFLTAVGGHGINAGQVRDKRVGIMADRTVFTADGHAGKVADMLVGSCELIEQCGLAAVLISHQGKSQKGVIGQWITVSGTVETTGFSQTGMLAFIMAIFSFFNICFFVMQGM